MKKDWVYKELGEVAKICGGKRLPKGCKLQSEPTKHKYIRVADFLDNGTVCKDDIQYISDDIFNQIKRYTISSADVYISIAGTIGKSGIVPDELNGANLTENACKLVLNKELDKRFVYLVTISPFFKEQINTLTKKSAQPKLALTRLATVNVPVPPLSEQKEIVEYLDSSFAKIDKLKENAAKNLEEAKALFQSALKDALEPKEGWEEKTLEHIATEMYRGSGIKRDQVTEEGISCVRYGEIYTTYNYYFDVCKSHTNEGIITSKKYFENGDILFAITGESVEEIGKSIAYLGKEKCLAGGDIVVMKHNQNPKFLSYALSTPNAIKQKGYGKTKLKVVHTNIPSLKTIKIPIPSIQEQIKIAEFLDSLNEKVNTLQQNYSRICSECDALKQAILRQVFE